MGLQIYHGQLLDMDHGRALGRVVDRGPYGLHVENKFGHWVGELSSETMCGSSFLTFRETPSPFSPQPLGHQPLVQQRGI